MSVSFGSGDGASPDDNGVGRTHKRRWLLVAVASVSTLALALGAFGVSNMLGKRFDASYVSTDPGNAFVAHAPTAYSEGQAFVETADYVKDNADTALVSNGKSVDPDVAVPIVVSYTRTSGDSTTLDDLWFNHAADFAGQSDGVAMLYDAGDGKYLVGRVAGLERGAKIVETMVGPYSTDGKTFEGSKFDAKTGLLYVPKDKAIEHKDLGLRMQMLAQVKDVTEPVTDLDVKINANGHDGVSPSGRLATSALSNADIVIASPNVLQESDIKDVKVNGISFGGVDQQMWGYDSATGTLSLGQPSVLIHDVEVTLTDNSAGAKASAVIGEGLDTLFGVETAHAAQADPNGYKDKRGKYNSVDKNGAYHPGHLYVNGTEAVWDFHGEPVVNSIVDFDTNVWYSDPDVDKTNLNGVWKNRGDDPNNLGVGNGYIGGALPLFPRDLNTYGKGPNNTEIGNSMIIDAATIETVYNYVMNNGPRPKTDNLRHQYIGDFLDGTPNPMGQYNPYYGLNFAVNHLARTNSITVHSGTVPNVSVPEFAATLSCGHMSHPNTSFDPGGNFGSGGDRDRRARVRILQVDKAKHQALVAMATPDSNSQAGVGMYIIKYAESKGKVTIKKFSAQADYVAKHPKHYSLAGAQYVLKQGDKVVHTFTTGADGKATDKAEVNAGTYTICETKASLGHDINKKCKDVPIAAGADVLVELNGEFTEPIRLREVSLKKESLKKVYSDNNNAYDLTGAEYTLYDENNNVVHVFVTDRDGNTTPFKVKYGTYTLRETKAPHEGYEISTESKTVEIGDGEGVYMF